MAEEHMSVADHCFGGYWPISAVDAGRLRFLIWFPASTSAIGLSRKFVAMMSSWQWSLFFNDYALFRKFVAMISSQQWSLFSMIMFYFEICNNDQHGQMKFTFGREVAPLWPYVGLPVGTSVAMPVSPSVAMSDGRSVYSHVVSRTGCVMISIWFSSTFWGDLIY
jgi:hypothetical protein